MIFHLCPKNILNDGRRSRVRTRKRRSRIKRRKKRRRKKDEEKEGDEEEDEETRKKVRFTQCKPIPHLLKRLS